MKKIILLSVLLAPTSASVLANTPFELSFSDEDIRDRIRYYMQFSRMSSQQAYEAVDAGLGLKIVSEEDGLVINNIIVNRGRSCRAYIPNPIQLNYAQSRTFSTGGKPFCKNRSDFREITVETNLGTWTFNP